MGSVNIHKKSMVVDGYGLGNLLCKGLRESSMPIPEERRL